MVEETRSFNDMVKKFGADLGLPKVDIEKIIEINSKNFDALTRSAAIASEGAKSLAIKQKEIVEAAFRDAAEMVRQFKPTGNPQDILAKQSEFARKAFEAAINNTRDIAETVRKTNADALKTVAERITETVTELRASFERGGEGAKKEP